MLFFAKIAIAVVVFTCVAELSKNSPKWGGLISALPWITLLVIITRHQFDQATPQELVRYLMATFWFILPTLLFVALMAAMLHQGVSFYLSLTVSVIVAGIANGAVAFGLAASQGANG